MPFYQSGKVNDTTLFLRIVIDNEEILSFQHNQKISQKFPVGRLKSSSKKNF